jgi:hypothetical protein
MSEKDIGDGSIAGIIAGLIIGILAIIGLTSAFLIIDIEGIWRLPIANFAPGPISAAITLLLLTSMIGLMTGAAYSALYENIPGDGPVSKGMIFFLLIWVIFGLLMPVAVGSGAGLSAGITAASVISSLIAVTIWGIILGLTYKMVKKQVSIAKMQSIKN